MKYLVTLSTREFVSNKKVNMTLESSHLNFTFLVFYCNSDLEISNCFCMNFC